MATKTEKILQDYVMAWNDHDVNHILAFLSEDCVYNESFSTTGKRGTAQLTEQINARLARFPNLQYVTKSLSKFGSCKWSMSLGWSGTDAKSSKVFWSYGVTNFEVHKHEICSERYYEIIGNVHAET